MIEPIEAYCVVQGPNLDVLELEKQLSAPLNNKRVRGQIGERGRYKGQPFPDGACDIGVPQDIDLGSPIEWLADFLADNMSTIKSLGAEDIVFWIVWRGIQGNMELSATELQKIADLGIPMAIHYYYLSGEEKE